MKKQDVKDMVKIVGTSSDPCGVRAVLPGDAFKIFREYKKLKKAIKKHKKGVINFGSGPISVDAELWEVLNDN